MLFFSHRLQGKQQMKNSFHQRLRSFSVLAILVTMLVWAVQPSLHADPPPVRYFQGTYHGFLEMLSPDGQVVAFGDSTQEWSAWRSESLQKRSSPSRMAPQTMTPLSSSATSHISTYLRPPYLGKRGHSFLIPWKCSSDARSGQFMTRTTGKDGKEQFKTKATFSCQNRPRQRHGSSHR